MANEINWSDFPAATTYLTTELDALADGANKLGAAIDNTANGDMYMDLELYVAAAATSRESGAHAPLYMLPSVDGTNYCYGSDTLDPPATALVSNFVLTAASDALYTTLDHILVPAGKFKMLIMNETGFALAGSMSTLKYALYNEEIQ